MSSQVNDNDDVKNNNEDEQKIQYYYWVYKGVSKRGHFVKGEKKGDNDRLIIE
jgi:hypothetical protein